ncbi:MAG: class I SAM-dependent methyltransferase [Blastocatellia bacterium]
MNAVLESIVKTRCTVLQTGEEVTVSSDIDEACGRVLQRAIQASRPRVGVEVGLAFGISTLYILEAMNDCGGEKLIGMDPAQHDRYWRGGGLQNIRRAGYERLYEFHEDTSQQVLPRLVSQGQRIEFAFIDGWHTFDHTLIDFFYIDQMLAVGGIVVFDDVGYPAIRRVCDFVIANRDYEIFDCVRLEGRSGFNVNMKYKLNRWFAPLLRTDKTPSLETQRKEHQLRDVYFLALRKVSDDQRRFDHFIHF